MKYVVVLFWALVLGQVVGYILASLAGVTQIPFVPAAVLSFIIAGAVILIQKLFLSEEKDVD